jgi:bloom syndrome protein
MMAIDNIDKESVKRYGDRFLSLIAEFRQQFNSMQQGEDYIPDPNHQNVITISSDGEPDGEEEDDDDLEYDQQTTSAYFPPPDVQAFNRQSRLIQNPLY